MKTNIIRLAVLQKGKKKTIPQTAVLKQLFKPEKLAHIDSGTEKKGYAC